MLTKLTSSLKLSSSEKQRRGHPRPYRIFQVCKCVFPSHSKRSHLYFNDFRSGERKNCFTEHSFSTRSWLQPARNTSRAASTGSPLEYYCNVWSHFCPLETKRKYYLCHTLKYKEYTDTFITATWSTEASVYYVILVLLLLIFLSHFSIYSTWSSLCLDNQRKNNKTSRCRNVTTSTKH